MKKRLMSSMLAAGVLFNASGILAAQGDVYLKEKLDKAKYTALEMFEDENKLSVLGKEHKYGFEGRDGKIYSMEDANEAWRKAKSYVGTLDLLEKNYNPINNEDSEYEVELIGSIADTTVELGKVSQLAPIALDKDGKKVDGVKFLYKSSNEDIIKVDEDGLITTVAEGEAELTVSTINAVKNIEATIKVDVVKELKDMTMKISPEKLVANGETVMEVEVKLNTPNAEKMGGMLEINSKLGLKASKVEEALDKGVARFKIQLPSSVKALEDVITVTVKSHDIVDGVSENELVGRTISEKVTYAAMGTEGGGSQQVVRKYDVASVRSMDMADRVAVYVGMENKVDLEEVKAAIVDQVKLYNDETGKNKIDLIKVEEVVEVDGGYAFISLIDLGKGKAENVLHDNQYNYYTVEKKTITTEEGQNNISLKEETPFEAFKDENKFMLIDGKRPEVRVVKATKNDNKYLPNDSILVEFDEPVNKITSEEPANWVINGKNLGEFDAVRGIELIDVKEAYEEGKAPEWTAITKGKERNSVIISLKPSFARKYLRNGQNNLLQVKSVADWAGMTDLSDNNKISTQEFTFLYDVPEVEQSLEIKTQSPEQFVISLGDVVYTDKDAKNPFKLTELKHKNFKVTLDGKEIKDFKVREVSFENQEYILELTKDWTQILDASKDKKAAYHGKDFAVSIDLDLYNVYGEKIKAGILKDSVKIVEDTTSPYIIKDKTEHLKGGKVKVVMNEPVQLYDVVDDEENVYTRPNLTPKSEQEKVSQPSFKYVKINEEGISEAKEVVGKVVEDSVDVYDREFTVEPKEELEAGNWKLVVRGISDDVGNTMKTESEIVFTIDGEAPEVEQEMLVDPYLVWGYVVDNDSKEVKDKDCELDKDYVVLLFSREMDIDVLKSSTYNINGKKIDQDAKITDELIEVYRNTDAKDKKELHGKGTQKDNTNIEQWVAHKIVIELPGDFIDQNKETNALTLPIGLKAVDDGVKETADTLLDKRQYQLDFNNYNKLVEEKLIPEFVGESEDKLGGALNDGKANKDNFIDNLCSLNNGDEEPTDPEKPGTETPTDPEKPEEKDITATLNVTTSGASFEFDLNEGEKVSKIFFDDEEIEGLDLDGSIVYIPGKNEDLITALGDEDINVTVTVEINGEVYTVNYVVPKDE